VNNLKNNRYGVLFNLDSNNNVVKNLTWLDRFLIKKRTEYWTSKNFKILYWFGYNIPVISYNIPDSKDYGLLENLDLDKAALELEKTYSNTIQEIYYNRKTVDISNLDYKRKSFQLLRNIYRFVYINNYYIRQIHYRISDKYLELVVRYFPKNKYIEIPNSIHYRFINDIKIEKV
jgi:hypothetical protein